MVSTRPEGCTNFKLKRLSRAVARRYDEDLRELGMSGEQYSLLSAALRLAPVRPGVLARHLSLDPSTLTRTLRPLVEGGWLTFGPGLDARSRLIEATPLAAELRENAKACWRVSQQRLNALLGAERVAALHALLDECSALLEAEPNEEPSHV
jgi:DNA-binding MarR family transcriptional regulator